MRSSYTFFITGGLSLAVLLTLPSWAQLPANEVATPSLNVNWLYGAYVPKDAPLEPLTGSQRVRLYVAQSFTTPGIYVKTTLFSSGDQIHGTPPEWGWRSAGYGRRFGSRYGQYLVQNTLSSTGNALLRYEPRYDRCHCSGLWPRTRHAFIRNFITYNSTEKEHRPQLALYAGALGSGGHLKPMVPGKAETMGRGLPIDDHAGRLGSGVELDRRVCAGDHPNCEAQEIILGVTRPSRSCDEYGCEALPYANLCSG